MSRAPLGDLSPETFLREYWQKKPLLIRGALPNFRSPLAPEELAGLALEEDVESRLVLERGGPEPWTLRHGPFEEEDFLGLPESHWSLLVQEVDRLIPEVAQLRERFRFIPDWRVDDVMVSYAPEHGTVGAHVDNYDVFLIQGLGRRRWEIGEAPVEDEDIIPDIDVRILADFEPAEEYVVEPGDLLYLPPRVAHYGVALEDCMTYSVGFRAPSHREIVGGYLEDVLDRIDPDARYADPDLRPPAHPGAISPSTLSKVQAIIREVVSDEEAINDWFGRAMTEPQRGHVLPRPESSVSEEALAAAIREGIPLQRHPAARLAYIEHDDGRATLFAAGKTYETTLDAARRLTSDETLSARTLQPLLQEDDTQRLLVTLIDEGVLHRRAA